MEELPAKGWFCFCLVFFVVVFFFFFSISASLFSDEEEDSIAVSIERFVPFLFRSPQRLIMRQSQIFSTTLFY